jgi:hypothetical protein
MKPKRKKDKHLQFVEKNLDLLSHKAAEGFVNQGKGVLIVRKIPGSNDINSTYISADEILKDLELASDTSQENETLQTLKRSLEVYNPETQFVLILHMKRKAEMFLANRAQTSLGTRHE